MTDDDLEKLLPMTPEQVKAYWQEKAEKAKADAEAAIAKVLYDYNAQTNGRVDGIDVDILLEAQHNGMLLRNYIVTLRVTLPT